MSDDLENRLRAAFRAARAPGASPALRESIRRIPLEQGAPGRSRGVPWWRSLRLAAALAAVVVVVAAVAALPTIGPVWLGGASSGSPSVTASGGAGPSGAASPSESLSPAPSVAPGSASASGSLPPGVPADFAPTSVSFPSPDLGWATGTGSCESGTCLWVLRTSDGGRSWTAATSPRPTSSTGLPTSILFADERNGWLYGPGLWATHDGGGSWSGVTIPGVAATARIADVEATAGTVYAAVLEEAGSIRVASAPADRDAWTLATPSVQAGAGPVPSPRILLAPGGPGGATPSSTTGWLIEVDRTVVGGLRLEGGAWKAWAPPCLDAAGPAILIATSATNVGALCDVGVWSTPKGIEVRLSSDSGSTFRPLPASVPLGSLEDASALASTVLAAGNGNTGSALAASFDGGRSWTNVGPAAIPGVVTDLAFADPLHVTGVAVTGDSGGRLLRSDDGGRTWQSLSFTAPG